jgi:hypothetical protein
MQMKEALWLAHMVCGLAVGLCGQMGVPGDGFSKPI